MNKSTFNKIPVFRIIAVFISVTLIMSANGVYSSDPISDFELETAEGTPIPTKPIVTTNETTELTNTSAKLWGYLLDDGKENCSTWFEWDDYDLETECAGLIATGTCVKNGRSIFWKNRHMTANNQKPYFYQGTNYSYYGLGQTEGMCRMGINEKGLAIGNFDISGSVDPDKRWYLSDEATGGEDQDMHIVLGNFSTVYDAAIYLAKHGTYTSQLGIVSAEEGVGAIVTLGADGWTNVTWVNNTWVALGNAKHCNGDSDSKMIRVREKINDIINNDNSSEEDGLINWRDVTQRLAKDIDSGYGTYSEPYGYSGTYYTSGINPSTARSAIIAVCGNESYDGALNIGWLSFGQTTHLSLFLPLGSSYLKSSLDIPSNFTEGNGIEAYTDVKQAYAEYSPNRYYRSRVHEILNYTFHNENLTFDEYENLMNTIMTCADESEAKNRIKEYADNTLQTALQGYSNNLTTYSSETYKSSPYGKFDEFNETITDLTPGTVYYYKAYAKNFIYSSNGSQMKFMTMPNTPTDLSVETINTTQINLSWNKGIGAHYTIIERNTISNWQRGGGTQIYNGTGYNHKDTQLSPGIIYNYQLWSFTSAEAESQYCISFTSGFNITHSLIDNTIYVDDDYNSSTLGWQITHFDNLQDGINAVDTFGTVQVYKGLYYENILVNKSINLIGENKNNTIIDGKRGRTVVVIDADMVNLSSFTIQNAGPCSHYSGIKILTNNNNIIGNHISNNKNGIHLINSNDNTISNNTISNNKYGMFIKKSSNNTIISNNISYNKRGLLIRRSNLNNISKNFISSNKFGIYIWHSSSNNLLFHNNLIHNRRNAYDKGANIWDNGYPVGGNYWDDYKGKDQYQGPDQDILGSDGIGDTPYNICGTTPRNQDHYPLIKPFTN